MTLLNYCALQTRKSTLNYFLWDFISPGWTAAFLILTGIFFFQKTSKSNVQEEEDAYKEAALVFTLWGAFNLCVYFVLVANNAKQTAV